MSGPPPVVIEFIAKGLPEIQKAMRSIGDIVTKSEREGVSAVKKAAREKDKAWADLVNTTKKWEAEAVSDVKKAEKEKAKAADEAAEKRKKSAKALAKDVAKTLKDLTKDIETSYKKDVAAAEKAERQRLAIRERSATMAGRYAKQQADAEIAAREKAEAKAQGRRDKFAQNVYGGLANGTRAIGSIASRAAQGVMNVGGGFSIEDSVQRYVAFKGAASTIANKTQTGVTQSQLEESARSLAIAQGIDPSDVLKGYDQVTKLDDAALPQALRVMPDLAKIATVTGTSMEDMGGLAANISASNPKISDEALKRQLRIFARQGIEGGVEVADFAKYGARFTAGAGYYAGDRLQNEAKLGMAAQVARQFGGAASPAEATLAAQRFGDDVRKKHKALKDAGVDVADKDGNLRGIDEILVDMLEKKNKVTEIADFKIGERGNRVLTGAADIYRQAGGGEAGKKKLREVFANGLKDISESDVNRKFDARMAETDKQLDIAMTKLRIEVGLKLVPKLKELIPLLVRAIPAFSKLLEGVVKMADLAMKNPFSAIGLTLSASIAKEVAGAGIAASFQKGIATSLGSAGAMTFTTAVMSIAAAKLLVEHLSNQEDERQRGSVNADLAALNGRSLLKPGGMKTQEDVDKAKEIAAGLQGSIAANQEGKGGGMLYKALAYTGAVVKDTATFGMAGAVKGVSEASKAQTARDEQAIAEQKKTLEAFTAAIAKATKEIAANKPPPDGPSNPGAPSRGQSIPKRATQ